MVGGERGSGRTREGQIAGLCGRGEDAVHPWLFCNRERKRISFKTTPQEQEDRMWCAVAELHPSVCPDFHCEVIQADTSHRCKQDTQAYWLLRCPLQLYVKAECVDSEPAVHLLLCQADAKKTDILLWNNRWRWTSLQLLISLCFWTTCERNMKRPTWELNFLCSLGASLPHFGLALYWLSNAHQMSTHKECASSWTTA